MLKEHERKTPIRRRPRIFDLDYTTKICETCGAKILKSSRNLDCICTSIACDKSTPFYESLSEDKAKERIDLSNKYLGLYFGSHNKVYRLHFLHALNDRKLVFMDDAMYKLLVVHEDDLDWMSKEYEDNNYEKYKREWLIRQ